VRRSQGMPQFRFDDVTIDPAVQSRAFGLLAVRSRCAAFTCISAHVRSAAAFC